MFLTFRYSQNNFDEWNSFLESAKNATFLFHRNFMDYHSDRFSDYSLIIRDKNGHICALLPANLTKDNSIESHEGLSYGGLVINKEEKLINVLNYFKEFLKFLFDNGIKTCRYKELPSHYNLISTDEQQYVFFLLGAKIYRRDTAIVIGQNSPLPFQKRRERAINKARKAGVIIKEVTVLDYFWNEILTPNLQKRFGVNPVHSLYEINLLRNYFPSNIRQFNAYLNGHIMAGTTIFETTNVAHAQYISASVEGRSNGSVDMLFNNLIKDVFAHKSYFDFGICNEEHGMKLNKGLLEWKEGFGGRAISHNFYEIKTSNYTKLDNFFDHD